MNRSVFSTQYNFDGLPQVCETNFLSIRVSYYSYNFDLNQVPNRIKKNN